MKDYIHSYFQTEVIRLEERKPEYAFVYSMVQKQPIRLEHLDTERAKSVKTISKVCETIIKTINHVPKQKHNLTEFTEYVLLQVPDYFRKEKRMYISPLNILRFHNLFFKLFQQEYIAYMDNYYFCHKQKLIEIIYQYMAEYNWTDDKIKADTLKKIYYRNKSEIEINTSQAS